MERELEFDPAREARAAFAEVPWSRFVAMGDSGVEGELGDPVPPYPDLGWPEMVAEGLRAVRPDLRFHNLGKRYLTTRQIRASQLERALALEPSLVLVWAGGNDLLAEGFDARVTEEELEAIITALEPTGATIVTGTMFNIFETGLFDQELVDLLHPRYLALNEAVRRVDERHDLALLDFARMPWTADPGLYSADLQHANRRGQAAGAAATIRCLADHLARNGRTG